MISIDFFFERGILFLKSEEECINCINLSVKRNTSQFVLNKFS